jgi:hypothetical protein
MWVLMGEKNQKCPHYPNLKCISIFQEEKTVECVLIPKAIWHMTSDTALRN